MDLEPPECKVAAEFPKYLAFSARVDEELRLSPNKVYALRVCNIAR